MKPVKLVRNTAVYLILGFLPLAVNFLLAPLYTHYLSPAEYALIGISTLLQTFVTYFVSLSLDSAFARLYFKYEKKALLKSGLLSSLLIFVIISFVVVASILMLFSSYIFPLLFKNSDFSYTKVGFSTLVITLSTVIFSFFTVLYRNNEDIKKFALLAVTSFLLPVLSTLVGVVILEQGAMGAIIGRAIGSSVIMLSFLTYFFLHNRFIIKKRFLRESLIYSLPLIPYQIMFGLFSNIDRIILERYFTTSEFGVYNFAALVTGVFPIFQHALSSAFFPRIYRELENEKNVFLIKKYCFLMLVLSVLVICLCAAGIVPAMELFIDKDYASSYLYIGTLFMSFIPYVYYTIFSIPLFFHGKTKAFPVISFVALASGIIFNMIFLPQLGIWSVCLSLYVIRIFQMLTALFFIKRYKTEYATFTKESRLFILSFIMILVYNILLYFNLRFDFANIYIINLFPVAFLTVTSILLINQFRQYQLIRMIGIKNN